MTQQGASKVKPADKQEVSSKGICACNEGPAARHMSKQRVYSALKEAAKNHQACGFCIGSAAMYMAALMAQKEMCISKEEFLEVASEVWNSVDEQVGQGSILYC